MPMRGNVVTGIDGDDNLFSQRAGVLLRFYYAILLKWAFLILKGVTRKESIDKYIHFFLVLHENASLVRVDVFANVSSPTNRYSNVKKFISLTNCVCGKTERGRI